MRAPAIALGLAFALLPQTAWAEEDDSEADVPIGDHAPAFSLWVGTRASFLAFGREFFENEKRRDFPSAGETTGNFVDNGFAPQLDLGARIARYWVPYLFYEHGFLPAGHRFEGSDATASTDSFGFGCRFGGADRLGFIADLSTGRRIVRVSRGGDTFTMSTWEPVRLALGGELRFTTLFTVEATVSIGGGKMNESSGDIVYSDKGSADGRRYPAFRDGAIDRDSSTYLVFGAGLGIHFDVFGR